MSQIRRRKPAEALAERLAAELVQAERHRLRGLSTLAEAKREVRADKGGRPDKEALLRSGLGSGPGDPAAEE